MFCLSLVDLDGELPTSGKENFGIWDFLFGWP